MTVIATSVTRQSVFQVSDRRLTISGKSGKAHDEASNKCIVVAGPKFLLTLSYTGVAYFDSIPTDNYLAAAIMGSKPELAPGGFIGWPVDNRAFNALGVLQRVRLALDAAYAREPKLDPHTTEVEIGGIQAARTRPRHVLANVVKRPGLPASASFDHHKATFQWDRQFLSRGAGAIDYTEWAKMRADLRDCDIPDQFKQRMVSMVRATSLTMPTVGPDAMSVYFNAAAPGLFLEYHAGPGAVSRGVWNAYTPWVITPGVAMAPAIASKSITWNVSGLDVHIKGPAPTPPPSSSSGRSFSQSGQKRKGSPR